MLGVGAKDGPDKAAAARRSSSPPLYKRIPSTCGHQPKVHRSDLPDNWTELNMNEQIVKSNAMRYCTRSEQQDSPYLRKRLAISHVSL